ncbi:hypothetical protein [Azonexus sp.]|uniref:hypothetical protein n=1 Tax=Azonexus sp. TaxID=1872668 RepID=UPI0039E4CB4F
MATAQIVQISTQKRTSIINRYLSLAQELARIKTEMEMLKVEAIEVLGEGTHETKTARVTINWLTRNSFDGTKAKTFLSPEQVAQCNKASSFFDVRVKGL